VQVPLYDVRVVEEEDGEYVKLNVELPGGFSDCAWGGSLDAGCVVCDAFDQTPQRCGVVLRAGVASASDITVRIEPPHVLHVVVPQRYCLALELAVGIDAAADSVRFRKKTGKLTMYCRVVSTGEAATATQPDMQRRPDQPPAGPVWQSNSAALEHAEQQREADKPAAAAEAEAAAAAAAVIKQQEEAQAATAARQAKAQRRRAQEAVAAAAAAAEAKEAAAAAAVIKQQEEAQAAAAARQAEVQRRRAEAEAAAAIIAEAEAEAAAAAAAAAAEEEARQERQRQAEEKRQRQRRNRAAAAERKRERRLAADKPAAQEWLK
jgi:hypothetical protein